MEIIEKDFTIVKVEKMIEEKEESGEPVYQVEVYEGVHTFLDKSIMGEPRHLMIYPEWRRRCRNKKLMRYLLDNKMGGCSFLVEETLNSHGQKEFTFIDFVPPLTIEEKNKYIEEFKRRLYG